MRGAVASKGEARKPKRHHHPSGWFGDCSCSKAGYAYASCRDPYIYGPDPGGGEHLHSGCRKVYPRRERQRGPYVRPLKRYDITILKDQIEHTRVIEGKELQSHEWRK